MKIAFTLLSCALLLGACAATPDGQSASAVAKLRAKGGGAVRGEIKFTQVGSHVRIEGEVTGLAPGPKGLHIHERGDCSLADGSSTGGHFDPREPTNWSTRHGGPTTAERHAGDLGNIEFDQNGKASVNTLVRGFSLDHGPTGILGRALVVHFLADDLKTDDAGPGAACGVIERLT